MLFRKVKAFICFSIETPADNSFYLGQGPFGPNGCQILFQQGGSLHFFSDFALQLHALEQLVQQFVGQTAWITVGMSDGTVVYGSRRSGTVVGRRHCRIWEFCEISDKTFIVFHEFPNIKKSLYERDTVYIYIFVTISRQYIQIFKSN